jgi:hypothetical protein
METRTGPAKKKPGNVTGTHRYRLLQVMMRAPGWPNQVGIHAVCEHCGWRSATYLAHSAADEPDARTSAHRDGIDHVRWASRW